MKRLWLLIPVLTILLLPMGCGSVQGTINRMATDMLKEVGANFTIKVGGTAGLNFVGDYEVGYLDFAPDSQSIGYTKDSYTVEGQVPQECKFEGDATSVMFQKRADDWWTLLSVEIWQDELLVAWGETTDPWGTVWLTAGMLYE